MVSPYGAAVAHAVVLVVAKLQTHPGSAGGGVIIQPKRSTFLGLVSGRSRYRKCMRTHVEVPVSSTTVQHEGKEERQEAK